MKFAAATLLALACGRLASVQAYPWMADQAAVEDHVSRDKHKRLLGLIDVPGALTGAGGLLAGLVGGIAQNVNPNDKRPDAAHPFIAPGPTDQRGVCPGLNLLANHGYLPRNGIVKTGQVIEAVAEGVNMGADLATLLNVIAIAFGGNIVTETFSIGGEDDRTYSATGIGSKAFGRQYGLNGHSRCEGDSSALRRDFYTNGGDNHNAYPDRFKRLIKHAQQNGGEFGVAACNALYGENVRESIANNPNYYNQAYTTLVILGEYPFIPNFMGNGTYGAGGTANYESIATFYGMETNADGSICYVPERFPENWYRRATPYGIAPFVAGLLPTYLNGPALALNPLSAVLNKQQIPKIGCAIYQGITSGVPAALLGETNDRISAVSEYLTKSLPGALGNINVYGCDIPEADLQTQSPNNNQYTDLSTGKNGYNICA